MDGDQPQGRDADHHPRRGAARLGPRAGRRSGPAEGRRGGPPPGAAGRQLRRSSAAGPAPWCVASTPPTSGPSTCCAATPTAGPSPSRSSAGARSTGSSSSPATWPASTSTAPAPGARHVRGPAIKPQAKVLAADRGIELRRGRLRRAARHRVAPAPPVLTRLLGLTGGTRRAHDARNRRRNRRWSRRAAAPEMMMPGPTAPQGADPTGGHGHGVARGADRGRHRSGERDRVGPGRARWPRPG